MMLLIRSFMIIFALHTLATQADLSTIERIKKHQEWLRQRGLLKTQLTRRTSPMDDRWKIKEPTKPLWHKVNTNNSNTNNNYNKIDDPRNNDVFPENETTTTKSITSVTTLSSISNRTTTELPMIPTEKPTTTTLITSTTIEPTSPKSTTNIPSSPSMTPSTPATITRTTIAEDEISTTTVKTTTTTINSTTASPAKTLRPKLKPKPYPRWGTWSQWSACSRTCGGGVMSQQRKCISKRQATGKRYISNDCIGVYRRYHLCNEHNCPESSDDFRQEQCSAFDDVDFQGRKYTWEPYIKDDAECELNCKPLGMKYFATLNNSVIDGTACFRPAEYYRSNYRGRAICVGGICKVSWVISEESLFLIDDNVNDRVL